jgi:dUTP pyrophosphatase
MTFNEYNIESHDLRDPQSFVSNSETYENDTFRYVSTGGDLVQGTPNSAGLDLQVHTVKGDVIGTGIYCQIPEGWVGLVVPRSSLGLKGFRLKNTMGVIDSDYRGEIKLAFEGYTPGPYERVAQLILVPHYVGGVERMISMEDLNKTDRNEGGFGSTGS